MMNSFYGRKIGARIGWVEDIDVDSDGMGWGPCLRLKVWIDLIKPLMRGTLISNEGNKV